ncbi:MAG: prepilin-type N-terminal cleavage/methylation domain-containing protein [Phycisphaerales bacterium]|nr:prepilin-type N-terminal cleavage/methylation domain-containing protein [Phycisphaerales bacterium]
MSMWTKGNRRDRAGCADGRAPVRARSVRAFTLIELLIAVVVLAIATPPLVLALSDASVRRSSRTLDERARWLAAERLEEIIADRHSAARGYGYVAAGNYPAQSTISGFPGFSRQVSVTTTGANFALGGTGYKTVTVTVNWTDPRGGAKSFALSSVVTDYTP